MVSFTAAALTDVGFLRDENEDSVWSHIHAESNRPALGLFVVCDGMGGHMGGKYASYWAVEAIKSTFAELFVSKDPRATVVLGDDDIEKVKRGQLIVIKPPDEPDIGAYIDRAIQKANNVVYEYATHKPEHAANAGTTVTMLVIHGTRALIANVGDSRTYLLRGDELRQISRDHSLVASLVAEKQILPDEVYTHPQRNVIYRYIGQRGMVTIDLFQENVQPGDIYLLCSDGLWEMVRSEKQLVELIRQSPDPLQACHDLIAAANAAGGEDNISAVVVKVV